MIFGSFVISFFYFVAIPTVIRSRLTTDTSAMSSFKGSTVKITEFLSENRALVQFQNKKFVVEMDDQQPYDLNTEVKLTEVDGKLSI